MQTESVAHWARNQFGRAQLKDVVRRPRRLVAMACAAARRRSGKVSVLFDRDDERAGAYDFLENPAVKADALAEMLFAATARRAAEYEGRACDPRRYGVCSHRREGEQDRWDRQIEPSADCR